MYTLDQLNVLHSVKEIIANVVGVHCLVPRAYVIHKGRFHLMACAPLMDFKGHSADGLVKVHKYNDLEVGSWCGLAKIETKGQPVQWVAVSIESNT